MSEAPVKRTRGRPPEADKAAKVAVSAAPKEAPEAEEDEADLNELEDILEGGKPTPTEEEAPPPMTRKQAERLAEEEKKAKKEKAAVKIVPIDDFMRDKKGKIMTDEDGDKMRHPPGHHKGLGFVTEAGVLFPVHYPFQGGFIGTFGNVILKKCPECRHSNSVDDCRVGICGKCGFNKVAELEAYEL